MRILTSLCALVGALMLAPLAAGNAAGWPAYRGADQTGICREKVNLSWPAAGPKLLWRVPTNRGFSSFAVADGKAFTLVVDETKGEPREVCLALDANTGKELWRADVGLAKYVQGGDSGTPANSGGDGPRSTPAVAGGLVYVFNQEMVLFCLDANTGKTVWQRDLIKENAGRNIGWKSAASPVVDAGLVFVAGGGPGQSLLGIAAKTGEVVWKSQDQMATHATPVVATILGERQVIFFCQSGLVAVSEKDGTLLWRFPFRFSVSTAASPIVAGDVVYCSAGYGVGGGACKIARNGAEWTATEMWKIPGDRQVANHWSTPVLKDGYLYGMFSFKKYGVGPMKCVELATGAVKWEQPGFGAGQVILVGDKVLALADDGQLVVVQADPSGYKELARFQAVAGKCWSSPALSNGRIYVRSTKEGACFELQR